MPPHSPQRGAERYSVEQITEFENAYDEAIAYLDHWIGRLLDTLESRDILDRTFVVITSDHGELFGEHGLMWHGNSLHVDVRERSEKAFAGLLGL